MLSVKKEPINKHKSLKQRMWVKRNMKYLDLEELKVFIFSHFFKALWSVDEMEHYSISPLSVCVCVSLSVSAIKEERDNKGLLLLPDCMWVLYK